MVNALPVSTTVTVERLAHAGVSRSSLFSRITGLMPAMPMRSRRTPSVRSRYRSTPPIVFAVYANHAVPTVYRPATESLGIRAGSWIVVQLRHGITDYDSALVVLHVMFAVKGLSGSLPSGTRLLARVQATSADRVQLSVSRAITPHDRRIPLAAVVFDRRFQLGLPGFVERGRRKAVLAAFGQSLLASIDTALGMVGAQGSLASQALDNAGRNTLGAVVHWRHLRHVLYIPAQRAYVQMQKGS